MKSLRLSLSLLFIVSFLFTKSYTQVARAGYHLSTYFDINPDTLINGIGSWPHATESYFFDINVDGQNDFELNATLQQSPGGSSQGVSIISLNPNSFILFGRKDSIYNTGGGGWWEYQKVAKPLIYGDTTNPTHPIWDCPYLNLSLYCYWMGLASPFNITDWVNPTDEYIAIKFQNSTDTVYGWIRVNCPETARCYLKDYSFGALDIGIESHETGIIKIYPNPCRDYIHIEGLKNATVEVLNTAGQLLKTGRVNFLVSTIELSGLPAGMYFLKVRTENEIMIKKISKK